MNIFGISTAICNIKCARCEARLPCRVWVDKTPDKQGEAIIRQARKHGWQTDVDHAAWWDAGLHCPACARRFQREADKVEKNRPRGIPGI